MQETVHDLCDLTYIYYLNCIKVKSCTFQKSSSSYPAIVLTILYWQQSATTISTINFEILVQRHACKLTIVYNHSLILIYIQRHIFTCKYT